MKKSVCLTICLAILPGSVFARIVKLNEDEYKMLAADSKKDSRCAKTSLPTDKCHNKIDKAFNRGFMTSGARDWAKREGLAPVLDYEDDNRIMAACSCGCFESKTQISILDQEDGFEKEVTADRVDLKRHQLITLEANSLTSPSFESHSINRLTAGEENIDLFVFELEDGSKIGVTGGHGMLLTSEKMVAARDVRVGDAFYKKDGSIRKIKTIKREATQDKVYNFLIAPVGNQGSIIVANDILVGDLGWQNNLENLEDQISLRE